MQSRRDTIRSYISNHESASIEELHALFPDKSAMTIRRDLDLLQDEGFLIRTHGGARVNPAVSRSEAFYDVREVERQQEKELIAGKAAAILGDCRSIYLDAGTTVMALVQRLEPSRELAVITHGANIALEASMRSRFFQVTMLGGVISPKSLAASGSIAMSQLDGLNIETAVMSASGFSTESGFTNGSIAECELKRAIIAKAHNVVMLMDASKLGVNLLYTFASPAEINVLVTDKPLPEKIAHVFVSNGVRIL